MKILIVVPNMNLGGLTISAVNLANELHRRKDEVHFLDMSNKYPKETDEKLDKDIPRHFLKGKAKYWNLTLEEVRNYRGIKKLLCFALGFFKKIAIRAGFWYKIIYSEFNECGEFDAAFAFRQCEHCYSYVLGFVPAKKKVGFVHGELTYMRDISTWKKYMTSFDAIAYVSDAVKNQFVSAYPDLSANAHTVYNTFDIEAIKKLAKEKPEIEFDKSKKNIVTVSRIDNLLKQIAWIPHICKNLKERTDIPFCWYIVGDGPGYDIVAKLIEETGTGDVLKLLGEKPNPYNLIAQADFTVLTSKTESYGLVVRESLILNKPVVVGKYPAIYEIVEENVDAIVSEQNIEDFTECVAKMLVNTLVIENYETNNDVAYEQIKKIIT